MEDAVHGWRQEGHRARGVGPGPAPARDRQAQADHHGADHRHRGAKSHGGQKRRPCADRQRMPAGRAPPYVGASNSMPYCRESGRKGAVPPGGAAAGQAGGIGTERFPPPPPPPPLVRYAQAGRGRIPGDWQAGKPYTLRSPPNSCLRLHVDHRFRVRNPVDLRAYGKPQAGTPDLPKNGHDPALHRQKRGRPARIPQGVRDQVNGWADHA